VERDAHAALGFLQAADRFFLLDVLRHAGAGRLSEWLGNWRAPQRGDEIFAGRSVLDLDAFLRPLGFEDASRRDFEAMTGPARENVAAFAEGVNAALRAMGGVYPPEYLVLPRPRPWHGADCLLAARASGFVVSLINLENELTFDAVRGHAGDELARRLYPEAPWEQAPAIERHGEGTQPEPPVHLPSAGSNNWAVAGWRSASGAPVVANDPHVPLLPLPTYWYHAHLECPEYRVQGGCFPGYPAFGFGHNGHLAWGCTTAFRDAWDLYRVHRLPGDRSRYRTPGGSDEIRRHLERRRVRFRRPAELAWESCAHGVLYPGWRHDDGADLAVRYVPSDAGRYLAGYRALAAAASVEAHRAALAEIHQGPFDFNHVYAHKDGHVGWEVFGRLPRRRRDGLFVRDAHDPEGQWEGFLDWGEMPRALNPASGFVVSANSAVDPAQAALVATLSHYEPRLRQERIEQVLEETKTHRPEDSMALQADVAAPYALPLRDALLALTGRHESPAGREAEALALLRAWDGVFAADSPGAALFFFTQRALGETAFVALLGKRLGRRFANGRRARPRLQRLLLDLDDPLRGDVERAAGRPLTRLADDALRAAIARIEAVCGPEPSAWAWGCIQRARLGSILAELPRLGRRLVALDAPFPGDDYTVNPSRSLDEGRRLRAFVGASSRFVCDLARPDEAFFAHSSGPSGDPASLWHANLCDSWARFEYFRSALWSADRVPDAVERVVIAPQGAARPDQPPGDLRDTPSSSASCAWESATRSASGSGAGSS
jgi:penicillin amidase